MAIFKMTSPSTLALFLALFSGTGYKYAANCVPGGIVRGLNQTGGKIGLYVLALKTLMPVYGNLRYMAEGPRDQCDSAANNINLNLIHSPAEVLDKYKNMKSVPRAQSMKLAEKGKSYLYMFRSKAYKEYDYIADCVPGSIVRGLNQTGGRIALYTMALKTILPGLFGDLVFLGQGNNSACVNMMNTINEGNKTVISTTKAKAESPMKEIGVMQGLNAADTDKSYLYVFKNKMWNNTWSVMIPNMQRYGLPANFSMEKKTTTTTEPEAVSTPEPQAV